MRKVLALIALIAISNAAMAHSHMPQKFGGKQQPQEAVTFTGVKPVPITVGNLNSLPEEYEITVNGEKVMETPLLGEDVFYSLTVPVRLHKKNQVEEFKICSTSIVSPVTKLAYRTRICTYAKLLWAE